MTPTSTARSSTRHFGAIAAAWLIAFGVVLFSLTETARAQTAAENYVRENVQRGLTILNNRSIPDAQRRTEFRNFLTGLTDLPRIALFTLGPARRTATPAQIDAFVDAFRNYAVAVYESRLKAYAGQTLRVTGSTAHGPNDYIVTTTLVDPTGRTEAQGEPIEVDFRVDSSNGRFVVIDASIVGVWLALEERDQFTAFLEENNGNLDGLTTHLNMLTNRLRGGGPSTPTH
jgi:phospholipid transport system substrate-binding protein